MTQKQIETLKFDAKMAVENSYSWNEPDYISRFFKKLDALMIAMYDLNLIRDWKKVDKIKKEVVEYMMECHKEYQKTA